jgi:lysozyme
MLVPVFVRAGTMIDVVIDLSHHNADPDFRLIRSSGILGVIHKATQGTKNEDPTYASRRPAALAAGLLWGAYHFGTGVDGVSQAEHFLGKTQPTGSELLVLDFEQNPQGPSMTLDQARAFVERVHESTGRYPGLYGGRYLKDLLKGSNAPWLANCWFWLVQYGPTPIVPSPWGIWTMWQYTDGTYGVDPREVPGVGRCDRDRFNGSENRLRALWGLPRD